MAPALKTIAQLDQLSVDQAQQQLYERLVEAYPQVDLTRGFVHDINLHLGAIVTALLEDMATQVGNASSLLDIQANPTTDPTLVDRVLSNYRVSRLPGTAAGGLVTVVLDAAVPVTIPSGAAFTAQGLTFATSQAYVVRTSAAAVASSSDLVLSAVGSGYAFALPVTSTTVGAAGQLRQGTALTPAFTIPHLVQAYAASDFTGGADTETNTALVGRLLYGLAAPTFSGRTNVEALVLTQPAFARVQKLSIIGAGDAEMQRDRHGLFPVAGFGRADVYTRTATLPVATALTKTATLVGVACGGGTWQISLGRDEVPGFYEVTRIVKPGAVPSDTGYVVTSDSRMADLSGSGWRPDVANALEAVYSPYQTAVVQFLDPSTPTTGLIVGTSTQPYSVTVSAMPLLADLQAFLAGRGVRPYGGDVLVKAPIPCFLAVSFTLYSPSTSAAPDTAAIAAALAAQVNGTSYSGQLHASTVIGVIRDLLPAGAVLGAIDMLGRLRLPDGTNLILRDPYGVVLTIPDLSDRMTSPRTVCLLLDPADVAVSVAVLPTSEV